MTCRQCVALAAETGTRCRRSPLAFVGRRCGSHASRQELARNRREREQADRALLVSQRRRGLPARRLTRLLGSPQ